MLKSVISLAAPVSALLTSFFQGAVLPVMDHWDWQSEGNCVGMPSENFFHPEAERGKSRLNRDRRAKAICHSCPVIFQCREFALVNAEPYGVWGGLSPEDRFVILDSKSAIINY